MRRKLEVDDKPICDKFEHIDLQTAKDKKDIYDDTGQMEGIRDIVQATADNGLIIESQEQNRVRLALGILLRLVLPLANGVARSWRGIRDVRILRTIKSVGSSRQRLTNMLACAANTISMSLSTVHVTQKIDPILKLMKLKRGESIDEKALTFDSVPRLISTAKPKCVTLNILAEPPSGTPIRADIIFIHGLHGSLANTWKQGLWSSERNPVIFERPPQQPIRPPKRPRYTRGNIVLPAYKEKRPRLTSQENEDYLEYLENISSSNENGEFPTFRSRIDNASGLSNPSSTSHSLNNGSNELSEYSKCWPGDWLPLDCPGVRVIALNYTTDPYLWRPVWKKKEQRTNIIDRSREMANLLIEHGVGDNHPIVWVGHSKGGLFIKQILVDSWESGRVEAEPLWRSSRGTFFYSVPHRGSHLASINAPLLRRSVELTEIEKNSTYVLDLHRRFSGLYHSGHLKIEVFSFVETALTLMSVLYLRIVGIDSADPGIGEVCGLHLDHREICKPRSRACILYKELVSLINKVC